MSTTVGHISSPPCNSLTPRRKASSFWSLWKSTLDSLLLLKRLCNNANRKKATYLAAIQDLDAKTMASKKLTSQSSSSSSSSSSSAGNPGGAAGGAGGGEGISAKEGQVLKVKLEQINVAQEVILIIFNIKKQMI